MKIASTIQKEQRKKERKQKKEKLTNKVLYTCIGIPYLTIERFFLAWQTKHWEKDEEKSKQKVVHEIARHIEKEMANEDVYYVYNAWRSEGLDCGNCVCLHYFPYETKHSKKTKIFKRVFMQKKGNLEEAYYNEFFARLQTYFLAYEDINVETGIEKHWHREYEYMKLTLKKDR